MRWYLPVLLLPLLVGCQNNHTILEHHPVSLPAGDRLSLVVEMVNGPITITTGNGKNITGKLTKRGVGFDKEEAERELAAMDFEMIPEGDNTVRIKAVRKDKHRWNNSGTEADLQVPSGSSVELITSNGSIRVEGKAGNVITKTSNGTVSLKNTQCPAVVTTSNANVSVDEVAGTVEVKTTNGNITVKGKRLNLSCQTSNGKIHLAGDVTSGEHHLTNSNGSITVMLPRECRLNVDATTSNGKVTTDFPIAKTGFGLQQAKNRLRGTIGEEETDRTLILKTSNGGIALKKSKSRDKEVAADAE